MTSVLSTALTLLLCTMQGVVAVVTGNAPDVLSHAAVRARNSSVMLAACHQEGPLQQLRELASRSASVCLTPYQVWLSKHATRTGQPTRPAYGLL